MAKRSTSDEKRAPDAPRASRKGKAGKDLVLVHGRAPDGTLHVLRQRGDRVEAGAMRAVEEGKPLAGEVVKLTPRAEAPILFDAETIHRGPAAADAAAGDGPAQVASDAYRKNWSRIFGAGARRRAAAELPN